MATGGVAGKDAPTAPAPASVPHARPLAAPQPVPYATPPRSKKTWPIWLGVGLAIFVVLAIIGAVISADDDAASGYSAAVVADLRSACSAGGVSGSGCDCVLDHVAEGSPPLYQALSENDLQQEVDSYLNFGYADLESFTLQLAAGQCGELFGINLDGGTEDPFG